MSLFFAEKNKIDISLAKLTKTMKSHKLIKLEMNRKTQQIIMNPEKS